MSEKNEKFIFFQECLTSLNSAWSIIDALDGSEVQKTVASAAFRMALIEYAKPYKKSKGVRIKRHALPLLNLSDDDRRLHECIIHLRDTVLVHSDLTVKDAKIYVGNIGGAPFPMIISNTPSLLPSLSEFRALIERSLDQLYAELPKWEKQIDGEH